MTAHTRHTHTLPLCSRSFALKPALWGQPRALPHRTVNTLQATCSKLTTPTRVRGETEKSLLRNQDLCPPRRRKRHGLEGVVESKGCPLGQNARWGGMGPLPIPTKARSRCSVNQSRAHQVGRGAHKKDGSPMVLERGRGVLAQITARNWHSVRAFG